MPAKDKPVTYILPSTSWAPLLEVIARDGRPGEVIEVHTAEMAQLAHETLQRFGRQDLVVRLRPGGYEKRPGRDRPD